MRDIRYFWKDGLSSVGMSSEVELPQFRVLGHKQRATEINLTTGISTDFILILHIHIYFSLEISIPFRLLSLGSSDYFKCCLC